MTTRSFPQNKVSFEKAPLATAKDDLPRRQSAASGVTGGRQTTLVHHSVSLAPSGRKKSSGTTEGIEPSIKEATEEKGHETEAVFGSVVDVRINKRILFY